MAEDSRTQKPGKVSLHPLKFEDALKGLLKAKPPEKSGNASKKRGTSANDGQSAE
jgi:hypothetical protein